MVAICRELTKIYEEVFRGTVSQAAEHFTEPRGEFTLVIEGKTTADKPQITEAIEGQLHQMYLNGFKAKEAIATVAAATRLPKKELYQTWLRLDKVWGRDREIASKLDKE